VRDQLGAGEQPVGHTTRTSVAFPDSSTAAPTGRLLQRPGSKVAVLLDRSGEGSWEGDAQTLSMLCLLSVHHLSLPTLAASALFLLYSLVPFTPLAARYLSSP
jgi:hypothetical protein